MFTVFAPALMACSTIRQRLSIGVRPASSQENSTSSVYWRACLMACSAMPKMSSKLLRNLSCTCTSEVAMKVWILKRSQELNASFTASISRSTARERPHGIAFLRFWPISLTEEKSPGDDTGKPASMTSTPNCSSMRAICSFWRSFNDCCRACSPSLKVVSKIITRLLSTLSISFPWMPDCYLSKPTHILTTKRPKQGRSHRLQRAKHSFLPLYLLSWWGEYCV